MRHPKAFSGIKARPPAPSGDDEWSSYSSALGRKFLKLDEFLKPAAIPTETEAQPAASSSATTAQSPAPASQPKQETGFLRKLFS